MMHLEAFESSEHDINTKEFLCIHVSSPDFVYLLSGILWMCKLIEIIKSYAVKPLISLSDVAPPSSIGLESLLTEIPYNIILYFDFTYPRLDTIENSTGCWKSDTAITLRWFHRLCSCLLHVRHIESLTTRIRNYACISLNVHSIKKL